MFFHTRNEMSLELPIQSYSAKRGPKSIGRFFVDINMETEQLDSPDYINSISSGENIPSEKSAVSGSKYLSRRVSKIR